MSKRTDTDMEKQYEQIEQQILQAEAALRHRVEAAAAPSDETLRRVKARLRQEMLHSPSHMPAWRRSAGWLAATAAVVILTVGAGLFVRGRLIQLQTADQARRIADRTMDRDTADEAVSLDLFAATLPAMLPAEPADEEIYAIGTELRELEQATQSWDREPALPQPSADQQDAPAGPNGALA